MAGRLAMHWLLMLSSITNHAVWGVAVVAFSRELILDFAGFPSLGYQRDLFPQSGVDRLVTVSRH
jgi:hypothetical protein